MCIVKPVTLGFQLRSAFFRKVNCSKYTHWKYYCACASINLNFMRQSIVNPKKRRNCISCIFFLSHSYKHSMSSANNEIGILFFSSLHLTFVSTISKFQWEKKKWIGTVSSIYIVCRRQAINCVWKFVLSVKQSGFLPSDIHEISLCKKNSNTFETWSFVGFIAFYLFCWIWFDGIECDPVRIGINLSNPNVHAQHTCMRV